MSGIEFYIIRKDILPSTQHFLQELVHTEELREGTLVIAEDQNSGIGQQDNVWESEAGKNLTFSFLLRPGFLDPSDQFSLNKVVSLAILQGLSKVTGLRNKLSVKWPNDIYAGNKKIGGILISNAIMGNKIEYSIIGVGINVNQSTFSENCHNPTSLLLETATKQDLKTVLSLILNSFSEFYQTFKQMPGLLDMRYLQVLYQFQQWKNYEIEGKKVEAMICGINEYGKLQLNLKENQIIECDLKEIKFL